jgi:hypothetical protein
VLKKIETKGKNTPQNIFDKKVTKFLSEKNIL